MGIFLPALIGLGGLSAGLIVANATEQPAIINEIKEPSNWDFKKIVTVGALGLGAWHVYKKVR